MQNRGKQAATAVVSTLKERRDDEGDGRGHGRDKGITLQSDSASAHRVHFGFNDADAVDDEGMYLDPGDFIQLYGRQYAESKITVICDAAETATVYWQAL